MNVSLKNAVAGTMAALIVAFAAVAPASAGPWWPHPHHFWGGWGPVAVVGGIGLGAAIASQDYGCIRYQPMYDRWGNYLGQRTVNVCY
jgi:hypothetical protein